ncbi:MAG: flagellar motor protein MotB [Paracoccaceae bacterium]
MPATDEVRPLIIKKKKVIAGGHHGGAWKVAYADFVTAMMAFFLLMWLLGATDEKQRKGLADYFNPTLAVSRNAAGGAGMLEGKDMFAEEPVSGSQAEGVPPKPTHNDDGPPLGDEAAVPESPPDAEPGAHAADGGEGAAETGAAGAKATGLDSENAAALAAEQAEQARLEAVGRQIAEAMRAAEDGTLVRHFVLRITAEGLVIEIVDADDQPLFASASAEPAPILPMLIDVLVPVLAETTNDIAVVGHTDAVPFGATDYSNWELSADRANAARRLLTGRGLSESRIARVTGKAAVEPLADDPAAPQNRRIAITLLRHSGHNPVR